MICNPFDVVEVPFPFSDLPKAKRRKALVLSTAEFNRRNGSSILLMITSAEQSDWYMDVQIKDLETAGLRKDCVVRMKTFTLDNTLILRKSGRLGSADQKAVRAALLSAISVS